DGVTNASIPAPTQDTIYALFLPKGLSVSATGFTTCQGATAYHDSVSITPPGGSAIDVAYVIAATCPSFPSDTPAAELQDLFANASGVLAGAASAPHPASGGYVLDGDDAWSHYVANVVNRLENFQACYPNDGTIPSYTGDPNGYVLYRVWA